MFICLNCLILEAKLGDDPLIVVFEEKVQLNLDYNDSSIRRRALVGETGGGGGGGWSEDITKRSYKDASVLLILSGFLVAM